MMRVNSEHVLSTKVHKIALVLTKRFLCERPVGSPISHDVPTDVFTMVINADTKIVEK